MNNETVEGFKLDDTFRLKFTPLTVEWIGGHWAYFSAVVEHNSSRGKRRPYLVLGIGPVVFQSGWLFDSLAPPSEVSK